MLTGRDIVPDILFEDIWTEKEEAAAFVPPMDLIEREDEVVLMFELPGISKDDINILYEDGSLTIEGKKNQENAGIMENYCAERAYGPFTRSIALNERMLETDRIAARLQDGILSVTVPKVKQTQEEERVIPIES